MDLLNLGIREIMILFVAFFYLIIGSIEDIKTREIMDYSNFSLVALGFILNLMFSLIYNNWIIMFQSILGFIVFYIVAYIMFYAGQWGGGDSKMIMGLGALFGLNYQTIPFMIVFFVASLFLGSIYGLSWTLVLSLKYRKRFIVQFRKNIEYLSKIRNYLLFFSSAIIVFTLLISREIIIFGLTIAFILLIGFYLWVFVKSVEKGVMIKKLNSNQLTEGDWIVEDVYFNKKKIFNKGELSKKDIQKIHFYIDKNNYLNKYFKVKIKNCLFKKRLIDLKENDILDEEISTNDFNFKIGHKFKKDDLNNFDQIRKIKIKRKFIFWNINKKIFLKQIKLNDILLQDLIIKDLKINSNQIINQKEMNHISKTLNENKILNIVIKINESEKTINPEDLKEGMELAEEIYKVDYICGPKDLGISREQIALLNKYEKKDLIKFVLVKEGVPFVPSFLMAFIFCLIFYSKIVFFFKIFSLSL